MEKCKYSFVYEQVGNNKLVTCNLPIGECIYQDGEFTSSSDSKKYIVCSEKGLAEKISEKEIVKKTALMWAKTI